MIRLRDLGTERLVRAPPARANVGPLEARVRTILDCVQRGGDRAVREYNRSVERWGGPIEAGLSARRVAEARVDPAVRSSLTFAADRIRAFHEGQRPASHETRLPGGSRLALEFRPIRTVGVYIPGGRAPYPSSVLMTTLAARAAGVRTIVLVTPPRASGVRGLDPAIAVAARIGGVDRVFLAGGAVAIGALAFGTETVPRVDKITGPGGPYVVEAKRQVYGRVGIDLLSGPSESVLVLDAAASLPWAAEEAWTQVEHGPDSSVIVIAVGRGVGRRVADAIGAAQGASRAEGDRVEVWKCPDLARAWESVDALAPESLYVDVANLGRWERDPPRCGALFLGPYSSVAFGDYVSGTNHVLPVGGAARFSGGLSVHDFGRWQSVQRLTSKDAATLAEPGAALADAEGMRHHAAAQRARSGTIPRLKGRPA